MREVEVLKGGLHGLLKGVYGLKGKAWGMKGGLFTMHQISVIVECWIRSNDYDK